MVYLPSGLILPPNAYEMLGRFCREEYAYYDGVDSFDPFSVTPMDVLVTNSVNSFVNGAKRIRAVHRGLAGACNPVLPHIRPDASLLDGAWPEEPLNRLLEAACSAKHVLLPVATKVLHRKRPQLIPMTDNVIIKHYLGQPGVNQAQSKTRAAAVGLDVIRMFRADLAACVEEVQGIKDRLARDGYPLSEVRLFEILVWISTEPVGHYRNGGA
ncbi:MAG: hypothetical protein FJW39_35525 [Acidobacteria bacterium]|nr:hypothetical protein [Acidobacteriota bacterium]